MQASLEGVSSKEDYKKKLKEALSQPDSDSAKEEITSKVSPYDNEDPKYNPDMMVSFYP